jgi:hypothetical protein
MALCSNCSALAQTIQNQQVEIAILRNIIAEARGAANSIAAEATQVMTQHGSPYKYNLAKGAREAAEKIANRLKV